MNAQLVTGFVSFASAVAAIAINALWQDAVLVFGVWCLLRAWPKLNAATRYIVWSATLVAAVVVPVATTLPFIAAAPSPVSTTAGVAGGPRTPILSVQAVAHHAEPSVVRGAGGGVASETLPRVSPLRFPDRYHLTLPLPLAVAVFALWAILAAVALVRLAVGIVRLEQLKRDALPLPVEYREAMAKWTNANKGTREVRLCVSDAIDVPVAIGLFDAMILIPRVLLDQLSETEVDQISLHELAHLRRADDWSNGLQRLIVALLAWNPAAAFAAQQLDLEREVACDDFVLGLTGAVRPYALCLTKMAETSSWPRAPIAAPGVFATRKHISLRIERLLGAGRNVATNLSVAPTAAAIGIVGALAAAIAFVAPSIAAPVATTTQNTIANVLPAAAAPPTMQTKVVLERVENKVLALATIAPSPAQPEKAAAPATVHVPAVDVHVPAVDVHVPAIDVAVPAAANGAPFDKNAVYAKARRELDAATAGKMPTVARDAAENGMGIGLSIAQAVSSAAASSSQSYAKSYASAYSKNAVASVTGVQQCTGCSFENADLSGKDLHGVNYSESDFSHAKLRNVNFSGGNFVGVDFSGADLHGASFRGANLSGCDFSKADLSGVDFTGAKLSGADFSGTVLSGATLREVFDTCSGCDFNHSNLAGLDLSRVHAQGIDLSGADLRNANLSGSTFTGVDFSHARMDGANLAGATLNGCDLGGVDLTHVDLSQTHLIGVDLSGHEH